jgi:hypothetical protein
MDQMSRGGSCLGWIEENIMKGVGKNHDNSLHESDVGSFFVFVILDSLLCIDWPVHQLWLRLSAPF